MTRPPILDQTIVTAADVVSSWDDVRKYVEGLERERDTLAKMDEAATSTFVHWRSRAQKAEAEIVEKDKLISSMAVRTEAGRAALKEMEESE